MVRVVRLVLVTLLAVVFVPCAGAWKTLGTKWHGRTVTYANLSPGYGWSLQQAVDAWNASGARVRFVPAPRSRAQVIVSAKLRPGTEGEAGEAGIRSTTEGWSVSAVVRIEDRLDRYAAVQVYAHELGHVLGLAHEDRGCSTMNPGLAVDHPFLCRPPTTGTWRCGVVTLDDAAGAVHVYGGRARAPAREFCPVG